MTNEEAIKLLSQTPWLSSDEKIKLYPAINMAIKALEKQIPKKPNIKYPYNYPLYCPVCGRKLTPQLFCGGCGQRIMFEEVEE